MRWSHIYLPYPFPNKSIIKLKKKKKMAISTSVQDRTAEFKSVLAQAQRRQNTSKVGSQRRSLLTDAQKSAANGDAQQPRRSDFARKAAEIGRGISATMGKLEKLAQRGLHPLKSKVQI